MLPPKSYKKRFSHNSYTTLFREMCCLKDRNMFLKFVNGVLMKLFYSCIKDVLVVNKVVIKLPFHYACIFVCAVELHIFWQLSSTSANVSVEHMICNISCVTYPPRSSNIILTNNNDKLINYKIYFADKINKKITSSLF